MTPDEVKRIRKQLGLTQSKFAELIGVHVVTVKKWETGALGMRAAVEKLIRMLAQHARRKATRKGR